MNIEELLKELDNSRTQLEQYVKDCCAKLGMAKDFNIEHDEELYEKVTDYNIWFSSLDEGYSGGKCEYRVLGCINNDLIVEIDQDIETIDTYPIDVIDFTELIGLALDLRRSIKFYKKGE